MPSKKPKTTLDHFLTFIMLAGLSTSVAIGLNEVDSNRQVQSVSSEMTLNAVSGERVKENLDADVSFDYSNIRPVTAENIRDALAGVNPYDLPVIGGVAIPDLNINLPIIKGVSDAGMFTGAATLDPDQQMGEGNYPLASHRSLYEDVLFGALHKAEVGHVMYLSDLTTVYAYTVTSNEVVDPTAMHVLDPTEDAVVTLITCTLDSKQRIIVRGELSDSWPLEDAPNEALDALSVDPENGYDNQYR